MARTLPHPFPLPDLDGKRIAANTLVIALHAAAFALLMAPARWSPPEVRETTTTPVVFEEREREIPPTLPPPEPEIVRRPEPRPVATTTPERIVVDAPPVSTEAVFETGEILAPPPGEAGPPAVTFDTGPQVASLEYVAHPAPRYPRRALMAGDEGRVLLRVFVDATGTPVDVQIERSSGHRDLDRAAREKVLAEWRFRPAMQAGVPVPAVGLVPIQFTIPR